MGTWGYSVTENDTAADVYDTYLDKFDRTGSHEEALEATKKEMADCFEDTDDAADAWLGLAQAQWKCGGLLPVVKEAVETLVREEWGRDLWMESGAKRWAARKKELATFLAKLGEPNPRPRKRKKQAVKRQPLFTAGDCLAVKFDDGTWGAGIITAALMEDDGDPWKETYGTNILGMLEYKSKEMPTSKVFESRGWLCLTHHTWSDPAYSRLRGDPKLIVNVIAKQFGKIRDRVVKIGSTKIRKGDPVKASGHGSWSTVFNEVVLQAKWDSGDHS